MELRQLRYFLSVANFGSFTRAAEHERIAQPSLSQQIRKLEDELGVRLFDRLGRRIRLTTFGARFRERARRVLAEVESAKAEVDELTGLRGGSVRVGAIPTVAPYLLPRALAAFSGKWPGIEVDVREDLTHSLIKQLAEGSLDLALLSLPVRHPALVSARLLEEPMLLAVPTSHPLWKRKRKVTLRELGREPFLLLRDGHCFRDDVLRICNRFRVSPKVVFEGGQFETLLAMVAAGSGVTLLPSMARNFTGLQPVGLIEFVAPRPTRSIGIVRAKEKYLTPAASAFAETLNGLWRTTRAEREGPGGGRLKD
jgi:LysR family hydrogen peroxide-inducible transcriptional activator